MNKIYSFKCCPVTVGLIAVSELASSVTKNAGRKLKKISLMVLSVSCLSYPMISLAGIVRSDIAYQIYRDFAENKGLFVPGATDIPVYDKDGNLVKVAGGYAFKTGGTTGVPLISDATIVSNPGQTYDPVNGPLPDYGAPGDSGSPLFAYDEQQKKWVIVAVLRAYAGINGATNWWNVISTDYLNQVMQDDFDAPVDFVSGLGPLNWTYDKTSGTGTLSQGSKNWTMHGQKDNDLNAGKNLVFSGQNGAIVLKDSVTQGAGYLEFKDSYTVSAESGKTWTGAGIITDKGTNVTRKVNGVAGDNLHKLGEGTLTINGTGVNQGGLKTGDGTVVLNQQADTAGNVQAFSSVSLASGCPTVVLGDARQVNPDNISWGYRGGKLDLNGNAVTFTRLQAADYGAVITNHAQQKFRLLLDLKAQDTNVSEPTIGNIPPFGGTGTLGNLYSMILNGQARFYILKSASNGNTLWVFRQ